MHEEVVEAAYKAVHAALRADLLDRVLQNSPSFSEQVTVELLVAMGGVDGVINEDVLGLDRVYVQAKRYAPQSAVGRPEIQAFT